MNILVTGSNGQLGSEIKGLAQSFSSFQFFFTDVEDLDITDAHKVRAFIKDQQIEAVINCAAYTNVDKSEEDQETAHLINVSGPKVLAEVTNEFSALFLHISTDFVFDGKKSSPYNEEDLALPLGVYGQTKLDGENAVLKANSNSVILRTSWLYSSFGNNFAKTMIRLGIEKDQLGIVYDQTGTPTYARDLAQVLLTILNGKETKWQPGVYHYSNEGVASWYDFTKAIHEMMHISCDVKPIEAKAYPLPAKRPHYSVLNKNKIKSVYNIEIPYWRDALASCMELIKDES